MYSYPPKKTRPIQLYQWLLKQQQTFATCMQIPPNPSLIFTLIQINTQHFDTNCVYVCAHAHCYTQWTHLSKDCWAAPCSRACCKENLSCGQCLRARNIRATAWIFTAARLNTRRLITSRLLRNSSLKDTINKSHDNHMTYAIVW